MLWELYTYTFSPEHSKLLWNISLVCVQFARISSRWQRHRRAIMNLFGIISLSHGRYFRHFWGIATFTFEGIHMHYLYTGNFTISTVKSRYSQCFNCLKLFYEDKQYPKYGRFWPREKGYILVTYPHVEVFQKKWSNEKTVNCPLKNLNCILCSLSNYFIK